MKKWYYFFLALIVLFANPTAGSVADTAAVQLGNEVLLTRFQELVQGKNIALVTNQTAQQTQGANLLSRLRQDESVKLTALFRAEQGRDEHDVEADLLSSPELSIPVYRLYGTEAELDADVLQNVDLLLLDIQDIGSRASPIISTIYQCLLTAQQHQIPVMVLDRPNPLGGQLIDGPVLEDSFISSLGIDNLPMAHGMTIGELALFFNRKIGADVTVIPMEGYTREMTYLDTGLPWTPTPGFPDLDAVLGYMATGLGEAAGIFPAENFSWVGGVGIDAEKYAKLLNEANLPGVVFYPDKKELASGVKLEIVDPRTFNPAKTGMYVLAYAAMLNDMVIPSGDPRLQLFHKLMGTDLVAQYLEKKMTPQQIEAEYASRLAEFKKLRENYLIYDETPYSASAPLTQTPEPLVSEDNGQPAQPATQGVDPQPVTEADKVAYLTFDDGPSHVTAKILDILKENEIQATFFVVGRNIKGNEALLKRIVAEGHAIGGHSFSHDYRQVYRDVESFYADFDRANQLIEEATGIKPTVFRYPGGSRNTVSKRYQDPKRYNANHSVMAEIIAEANKRGLHFVDWNVENGDGRSNNYTPAQSLQLIKQQVTNQKEIVILMHDSALKQATADSLPEVIAFLREKGYTFAVLDEQTTTVSTVK